MSEDNKTWMIKGKWRGVHYEFHHENIRLLQITLTSILRNDGTGFIMRGEKNV